jgi:uncharacterized protein (DUF488 family)
MMRIFTVGYAGRTFSQLVQLLKERDISVLIDVRRFPISKWPEFGKEFLERQLPTHGIAYVHLVKLGGYRRGYETYMGSADFQQGIEELLRLAKKRLCCLMCLERDHQHCHRRFIAAHLKAMGIDIIHL